MSLAVVIAGIAPLYIKPEPGCELADEALYGMTVEVLEAQGDYRRVRTHYRYEGWTPAACLLEDDAAAAAWDALPKQMVQKPYIDVLDAPKVQGFCVQSMPRGALLCPAGEPDESLWRAVRLADGRQGYTKETYLAPAVPLWQGGDEERLRRAVCDTALSYLGAQYRWGGKTPLGIDCSGLVSMAYLMHGVVIYRDAAFKRGFALKKITLEQAKPGDLLFFPGHVAMYLGDGRFIHSTGHTGTEGVVLSSLVADTPDYRGDLLRTMQAVGSVFEGEEATE